jgi:hypothetical protein
VALTAVEQTGSTGVDNNRGDQWSRERRGVRDFLDQKQNDTGWATSYEPLLIVLESGMK